MKKPNAMTADCRYCRKGPTFHVVAPSKQEWCKGYWAMITKLTDVWGNVKLKEVTR